MKYKLTLLNYMSVFFLSACLLYSYPVAASTNTENKTVKAVSEEEKRKNLSYKLAYFKKLVYQSPRIKGIDESSNTIAKSLLEKIRSYYVNAKHQFEQGNFDETEKLINQGFAEIPKIFYMVKDRKEKKHEIKGRYKEILKRVESFILAFNDVVSEKGSGAENILNMSEIEELLNKAKGFAKKEHYLDAYNIMKTVSNQLEVALSKARHKETIVYKIEFPTPKDEYIYELNRNKTYMQVAKHLMEHYPPQKVKRLPIVKRLYQKNIDSIAQANGLFMSDEIEAAIVKLELGTKYLVQALRLSGLSL